MNMPAGGMQVEEMVGLEGGFVFSELLLQRIWLRGAFLRAGACTLEGKAVECLHPGRWNRRGGPDFLGARLRIGGVDTVGDVELHLRESDWVAHGHAGDAAYAGVVLHVVLFPPREALVTAGVGGRVLPILALLPLLPFDLEEHALDEAAEQLAGRPCSGDCEALLALAPQDCIEILDTHARVRWTAKLLRAASRLEACGWEESCHRGALEALGCSLNRGPMLRVGERHPLADWRAGLCEPGRVYAGQLGEWRVGGRPANHPLQRLRQYQAWVRSVPDWPARLLALGPELATAWRAPLGLAGAVLASTDAGSAGSARLENTLSQDCPRSPARTLSGGAGDFPEGDQAGKKSWQVDSADFGVAGSQAWWRCRRRRGFGTWREGVVKELCCGVLAGPRFDSFICDHCLPLLARVFPDIEGALQQAWLTWCPGDVPASASVGLRRVFAGLDEMQLACNGAHQGFIGWGLERRRLQDAPCFTL